jgi:uncharacterized protein YxeA
MKKILLLIVSGLLIACIAGSAMASPGSITLWNENFTSAIDGTDPSHQYIPIEKGDTVEISTKIAYLDQEAGTYYYQVSYEYGGGATESDFQIKHKGSFTLTPDASPLLDQSVVTVTCLNELPSGAYVKVIIGETTATIASASGYVHYVPESPTVALPVAAILGLVFILGRKKGRQ